MTAGPVKKAEKSNLTTFDLGNLLPNEDHIMVFDLKHFLYKELILKEKDFRDALKSYNWNQYSSCHVNVLCSNNAIIPQWAYMLVASYLSKNGAESYVVSENEIYNAIAIRALDKIDYKPYSNERVVIKGCNNVPLSPYIFVRATEKLQPFARSIAYGESCSTVPVFKG